MKYIVTNIEWRPNQNFPTEMVLEAENDSNVLNAIVKEFRYAPKSFEYNKVSELYILRFTKESGEVKAFVVNGYTLKDALNILYKDRFEKDFTGILEPVEIISNIKERLKADSFSYDIFNRKHIVKKNKYSILFRTKSGCEYKVIDEPIKACCKEEAIRILASNLDVKTNKMAVNKMLKEIEPKCILKVLREDGGENNIYPATLEGHLKIIEL